MNPLYPLSGGVYHIREVGTFVNGTGAFKIAFGNLAAEGPFGSNVMLYDLIQLPPAATAMRMFWVAPFQGMIGSGTQSATLPPPSTQFAMGCGS